MANQIAVDMVRKILRDNDTWMATNGEAGMSWDDGRIPDDLYATGMLDLSGSDVLRGGSFLDQTLGDLCLRGADISGLDLYGGVIDTLDLRSATARNCWIRKPYVFTDIEAREVDFSDTTFSRCNLENSDLTGARLDRCLFSAFGFYGVRLAGTSWEGAKLANCTFAGVDLTGVRFDGLTGTLFRPDPANTAWWWARHARDVYDHINAHGGSVVWWDEATE